MEHSPSDPPAGQGTGRRRRRMTGARWRPLKEGAPLMLPVLAAGFVAAPVFPLAAPAAVLAAGAVALAFRDPERAVSPRPDTALAPADGRVVHVGPVWDEYWDTELTEIAIFLALWDVHVQRSPMDGEVVAQRPRSGGYRPAMTRAAAHGNNQLATYLSTLVGPCTITQISGMLARRIVNWTRPGDRLGQGERLGMIKLGSQVTLRVPPSVAVLVSVGDRVRAGLTPIAQIPPHQGGR